MFVWFGQNYLFGCRLRVPALFRRFTNYFSSFLAFDLGVFVVVIGAISGFECDGRLFGGFRGERVESSIPAEALLIDYCLLYIYVLCC